MFDDISTLLEGFKAFNFTQFLSAFIVLFAMIDVTGLTPVVIDLQKKSGPVNASKAAIVSMVVLTVFLYAGNLVLDLFGVDIESFAAAGAIVIFLLALEMIMGIELFHYDGGPQGSTTLVPVVFPLIAGAGTFTALLSLRAEFRTINILSALAANMVIVYAVLKQVHLLERVLGEAGIYVLRRLFGIILLAIAVKLFANNIAAIINMAR